MNCLSVCLFRFRLLFRVSVSLVARRELRCPPPPRRRDAPVSISRVVALVPANRPSRPKIVCAYRARSALLGRATRTSRRPRAQAPPAPSQRSRPRACAPPARCCSSCTRRSAPCAALASPARGRRGAAVIVSLRKRRVRAEAGCKKRVRFEERACDSRSVSSIVLEIV